MASISCSLYLQRSRNKNVWTLQITYLEGCVFVIQILATCRSFLKVLRAESFVSQSSALDQNLQTGTTCYVHYEYYFLISFYNQQELTLCDKWSVQNIAFPHPINSRNFEKRNFRSAELPQNGELSVRRTEFCWSLITMHNY